jgi:hypothetical protein
MLTARGGLLAARSLSRSAMARTRNGKRVASTLAVAAAAAMGCGAPGGAEPRAGGAPATTPAASCVGPVPAHATLCPGAEADLASDAPRALAPSCACAAPCAPAACSYTCDEGYVLAGDACASAGGGTAAAVLVDRGDGTVEVADGLGDRTWLRDASCMELVGGEPRALGAMSWWQATAWAGGLADGACGLRDGSSPGDWRLPTPAELMHLQLALRVGATPFANVQPGTYWSSFAHAVGEVGAVDLSSGQYLEYPEESPFHAWPIRR